MGETVNGTAQPARAGTRAPQVSIGVPVYNGARFIRQTLNSLLAQTFQEWEIIISDNASTDDTPAICQEYVRRDRRVRYFRNPTNLGSTRNFNRTVELASGRYFKLANADDLCSPDLVATCVEVLDRHPEVVLCYGRATLIDADGRTLQPFEDRLDLRQTRVSDRFWHVCRNLRLVNVLQGVMRAEALRRTGMLGPYIASDMVLVAELALHGQFRELPTPQFFRRMHAGAFSSMSSRESEQAFVDPRRKGGRSFELWRHELEYHRAVLRAPLPAGEKARLTAGLLWLGTCHWRNLLRELVEELAPRRRPQNGEGSGPAYVTRSTHRRRSLRPPPE